MLGIFDPVSCDTVIDDHHRLDCDVPWKNGDCTVSHYDANVLANASIYVHDDGNDCTQSKEPIHVVEIYNGTDTNLDASVPKFLQVPSNANLLVDGRPFPLEQAVNLGDVGITELGGSSKYSNGNFERGSTDHGVDGCPAFQLGAYFPHGSGARSPAASADDNSNASGETKQQRARELWLARRQTKLLQKVETIQDGMGLLSGKSKSAKAIGNAK